MALVKSLKDVDSKHDIAIMIPADKEESLGQAIRKYGILDIPGVFILPKENICLAEADAVTVPGYNCWHDRFFKLQAAACTEFDKIVMLDCDQMVVKNMDHLFDAPMFTATTCGRCVHPEWLSLSTGLLVLEPSRELHAQLQSLIVPCMRQKKKMGLQASDWDAFNKACPDWRKRPELYLPEKYNICWGWIPDLCKKEKCKPKDFYMIRFMGKEKPWEYGKLYFLQQLVALIRHKCVDKLIYRVGIWCRYRMRCEPIRKQ
jgi:alpha-N-acetylglucosamine transferase